MDLRLLFSTFGLVFLAELGDKTQPGHAEPGRVRGNPGWPCFLGSAGKALRPDQRHRPGLAARGLDPRGAGVVDSTAPRGGLPHHGRAFLLPARREGVAQTDPSAMPLETSLCRPVAAVGGDPVADRGHCVGQQRATCGRVGDGGHGALAADHARLLGGDRRHHFMGRGGSQPARGWLGPARGGRGWSFLLPWRWARPFRAVQSPFGPGMSSSPTPPCSHSGWCSRPFVNPWFEECYWRGLRRRCRQLIRGRDRGRLLTTGALCAQPSPIWGVHLRRPLRRHPAAGRSQPGRGRVGSGVLAHPQPPMDEIAGHAPVPPTPLPDCRCRSC